MIGRLGTLVGGLRSYSRSRGSKDGSVRKRARSANHADSTSGANSDRHEGPPPASQDRAVLKESFGTPDGRGREVQDRDLDPRELERRQQEEKEFIRRNDTSDAKVWLLVDVQWLQEWKQFVTRGGQLPGPVDNSRLIDAQTGRPQIGLRPVDDYRGVNPAVWAFWHQRYGGGPMIRRRQLDLYAAPVDEDPDERARTLAALPDDVGVAARADSRTDSASRTSSRQQAPPPRAGRDRDRDESPSEASSSARGSASSSTGSRPRGGTGAAAAPVARGAQAARGRTVERNSAQGPASRGSPAASSRGQSAPALRNNADNIEMSTKATKPPCCDKCDGPHETDECPHFRRARENHKDAWTMLGKGGGLGKENVENAPVLPARQVRVVPQPGDGSCLFHSLSYGLSDRSSASTLRREICAFIAKNPEEEIGDTALKDWVSYDSGGTVNAYAQKMSSGTWGGGIEMAALTRMKHVNVHVYEKCREGYRRISAFESPGSSKTVNVLYQGRMHYDAIVV